MSKLSKMFMFILAFSCVAGSIFAGCGKSGETKHMGLGRIQYADNGEIYPMQTNEKLWVWGLMGSGGADSVDSMPFGKEWERLTGVDVEFQQPAVGSNEGLALLLASGDLPDIIIANLYDRPGGIKKFVEEDVIIELNEAFKKYAPHLSRYLQAHPDVDKMVKSDHGSYYMFPFIRGDETLAVSSGLAIRKDLLDQAGLPVPETIDEWYEALRYFKSIGADAPLSYDFSMEKFGLFLGAYGVKSDFFVVDGKVKYGFLESNMIEAIGNLKKWYEEGLLDKNIMKIADLNSNILSSETCASFMWAGSGIGEYMNAMRDKGPNFNLAAAKFPVLNKGETPMFGTKEFKYNPNSNAFITTACEHIELATRFLDFGYSDRGGLLFNFGVEGESYQMVDGYPTYTELITKNPEGLTMSNVMRLYMRAASSGPFVQDKRYVEQYYVLQQQKEAIDVWGQTDAPDYNMPYLSFTTAESQELGNIMNQIKPFAEKEIFKYMMGIEPLENYDLFVKQLKNLHIDRAVSIYQDALDRYNKR